MTEHDVSERPVEIAPARKRSRVGRLVIVLLILVAAGVAALVMMPSPIDAVAYEPPTPVELVGPLAANEALRQSEILARGQIVGAEDVDVDGEGRIYGGTLDGKIMRLLPDKSVETFAVTGGRPLGLHFDSNGNLIVADAVKGLLSINPDGAVSTLATSDGDVAFGFTDDLDIARDGRIYFSDASDKFGEGEYMYDFLEGRPHGRLLRYDPGDGQVESLLDGLYFANGIAMAEDDSFVLVNETYRYRVTRYWLKGDKAGTSDAFGPTMPGFPDGISRSPRGTFWVAIFTVRNSAGDWMASKPLLREIVTKLPSAVWPKPEPYGMVVELDANGDVLRSFHDPGGAKVSVVTSVHEVDGQLLLGTLLNDFIARFTLPEGDEAVSVVSRAFDPGELSPRRGAAYD